MFQISRWAGRNPALVRFIILPILFYVQCRMAFVLGVEMFFEGTTLSIPFLLAMLFINIGVCLVYPFNARELMHKFYYRLKVMQLVACFSSAALWGFIGNQTAAYFEHVRMAEHGFQPALGYPFSVLAVTITSSPVGETESSMLTTKTVFKKYFKNAIAKIKKNFFTTSTADRSAKVLLMILGILLLGIGVVVLVCGIECGGSSGAVALAVIGGLALLGLGIWALIGGFRRAFRMMRRPMVN